MCALVTGVQTCALPISVRRCLHQNVQCFQAFLSDLDDRPDRIQMLRAVIVQNPHNMCRNRTIAAACPPPTAVTGKKAWSAAPRPARLARSEEHTSELQSLMRISYAVFCLKKKNRLHTHIT